MGGVLHGMNPCCNGFVRYRLGQHGSNPPFVLHGGSEGLKDWDESGSIFFHFHPLLFSFLSNHAPLCA
mgnify:CR=1 FL=1